MFGPVDCVVFVGLLFTYLFYVLSLVDSVSSTWVREAFNHLEIFAPFFFFFTFSASACQHVVALTREKRRKGSRILSR